MTTTEEAHACWAIVVTSALMMLEKRSFLLPQRTEEFSDLFPDRTDSRSVWQSLQRRTCLAGYALSKEHQTLPCAFQSVRDFHIDGCLEPVRLDLDVSALGALAPMSTL